MEHNKLQSVKQITTFSFIVPHLTMTNLRSLTLLLRTNESIENFVVAPKTSAIIPIRLHEAQSAAFKHGNRQHCVQGVSFRQRTTCSLLQPIKNQGKLTEWSEF